MAKKWVPVRLTVETYQRICAMRQSVADGAGLTGQYDPADPELWLSVDELVSRLLDARDDHARRSRASGIRIRQQRLDNGGEPTP